jgi:hypothetical protein
MPFLPCLYLTLPFWSVLAQWEVTMIRFLNVRRITSLLPAVVGAMLLACFCLGTLSPGEAAGSCYNACDIQSCVYVSSGTYYYYYSPVPALMLTTDTPQGNAIGGAGLNCQYKLSTAGPWCTNPPAKGDYCMPSGDLKSDFEWSACYNVS